MEEERGRREGGREGAPTCLSLSQEGERMEGREEVEGEEEETVLESPDRPSSPR